MQEIVLVDSGKYLQTGENAPAVIKDEKIGLRIRKQNQNVKLVPEDFGFCLTHLYVSYHAVQNSSDRIRL